MVFSLFLQTHNVSVFLFLACLQLFHYMPLVNFHIRIVVLVFLFCDHDHQNSRKYAHNAQTKIDISQNNTLCPGLFYELDFFPTFSISFHSKDCVVNDLLNSMAFFSQIRSHVSGKPWYLTKSCCSHLASSSISVIEHLILKQQKKKENRERQRKKLSVNLC